MPKVDMSTSVHRSIGVPVLSGEFVGIELEYEKVTKSKVVIAPKWMSTVDYSLRAGGMEYVSEPLRRREISSSVREMINGLAESKAEATKRCGLHVHVNVSDLTWVELYKYMTLYTLLEPLLFKVFAPGREDSHFCVPTWANTHLTENLYIDGCRLRKGLPLGPRYSRTWGTVATYVKGGGLHMLKSPKYAAMNVASLKKFGTLEFRQAPATLDPETIVRWATLLLDIRKEALEYEAPESIVEGWESGDSFTLCERLGLKYDPEDTQIQEDAIDAAITIAGHDTITWQELNWEVA